MGGNEAMQNRAGEIEEQGDAENHDDDRDHAPVVHPSGGLACTPVEDEAFETAHLLVAPRSLGAAANGLTVEIRACNVLITQPCA